MSDYQIDLLKHREKKNEIAEVVSLTIFHPVLSRVYEKHSIVDYLGEFCMLLDKPTREGVERIKLSSSLIYWDIIFVLIDNRLEVFADDVEKVNEMSRRDPQEMENLKRNVFLLNFAAANFYSFSHINFVFPEPRNRLLSILTIV